MAERRVAEVTADVKDRFDGIEGRTAHTADGSIRERPEKRVRDWAYKSDKQLESYGVQPDEDLRWVFSEGERYGSQDEIEVFQNQVEDVLADHDKRGTARVLYDPVTKKPVRNGRDLVLMAFPKEYSEIGDKARAKEIEEHDRALQPDKNGGFYSREETFDPHDHAAIHAANLSKAEAFEKMGIAGRGSPTYKMDFFEAEAKYTEKEIQAMQDSIRRSGRHNENQWQDMMDGFAEERKQEGRGRSHAFSDSGFRRNPKSPLAQAQASKGR